MKKVGCFLMLTALFLGGCAVQTPMYMYYWDGYSQSLYNLKKHETAESLEAHKKTLLGIIQASGEKGLKAPPGVCCEYGYLLVKEGKQEEGMKYIAMEEQAYPESQVFIERLQGRIAEVKEPK